VGGAMLSGDNLPGLPLLHQCRTRQCCEHGTGDLLQQELGLREMLFWPLLRFGTACDPSSLA